MEEGALTRTTASGASSRDDPAPRLPTEICGRIIDQLAAELFLGHISVTGNPNLLALRSCALVCRDWYFHTWYHLRQRIHLRGRNDVLSLSRTLRERPRLRGVVQQVVISGHSASDERSVIQHLGTFAAMLSGKLPELLMISITDAEWTVGSMRMQCFECLTAFRLVHTLAITNVTVPSIAQLARLISALPGLGTLWCDGVECSQKHPVSPVSLPVNSAHLEQLDVRWVAPAIQDLLVRISQVSRLRKLVLAVVGDLHPSSRGSRSQALLDASAGSMEVFTLYIDPDSSMDSDTVDSTVVEQHLNLSSHASLWRLQIYLRHPFVAWSWIPHIVSRIPSKYLASMSVIFFIRAAHAADDLDGALTMMEEDGILVQLDDTLQAEYFADIAPGGICLGFDDADNDWTSPEELFGTESSFRERHNRWDELIRRKMPRCNVRGILTTVYSFEEETKWRSNMDEFHEARQNQESKTGVEVQREDDAEHAPDSSG
ncbi:uncharacterized protein C8Q71DRAFT_58873 [Rhodofomes roseus]|uniref:F-box domain-containing protein n=1 Tax=Rhodofomes roseus TaxID=34475 RepID=A0ABQ8KG69_9APHY|nr:uncharacterized protein C8Q71DRAFT_58873 [Rhodofomes roseus]KAH9836774.1 hypothetical protein C8Q71DRAFT_58873 [Rhodofomes roseus]